MPWQNIGSPFVVISPNSGLILIYAAPGPGPGTLVETLGAPSAGTDQYGNNYLQGDSQYNNASGIYLNILGQNISWGVFTAQPGGVFTASGPTISWTTTPGSLLSITNGGQAFANFAGGQVAIGTLEIENSGGTQGAIFNSSNLGSPSYSNQNDLNTYNFGKAWSVTPGGGLLINSTSPIVTHTLNVTAGIKYHYNAQIMILSNQSAGTFSIGFDGSATVSGGQAKSAITFGASSPVYTLQSSGVPTLLTSGTMTTLHPAIYEAEGVVDFSVSGVFNIRAQLSVLADTCTIQQDSFFCMEPCN